VRRRELLERLVAGHRRNVRFADFVELVEDFGFVLDRQRGSHRLYRHPNFRERLNLQPIRGEAKVYQIEQFLSLVAEHRVQSPYGIERA